MKQTQDISEAEWRVMKALWTHGPQTGAQIIEALARSQSWHPSTIKTLLGRLRRKRILGIRRHSKPFLYVPQVSERECLRAQSKSFLRQFFAGSVKPLLVHFVKERQLSRKDLDELRRMLDQEAER